VVLVGELVIHAGCLALEAWVVDKSVVGEAVSVSKKQRSKTSRSVSLIRGLLWTTWLIILCDAKGNSFLQNELHETKSPRWSVGPSNVGGISPPFARVDQVFSKRKGLAVVGGHMR